jgi:GNAT superfamily N-acetyltransferase
MIDHFEIKPLDRATIPDAGRLVAALRNELNRRVVTDADAMAEVLVDAMGHPEYLSYLAFYDGEPVGYLGANARYAIYAGGAFGQITELYVVPDFRSRGCGHAMIDHMRAVAHKIGWSSLEVGAPDPEKHPRTLPFYIREGFSLSGPRLALPLI